MITSKCRFGAEDKSTVGRALADPDPIPTLLMKGLLSYHQEKFLRTEPGVKLVWPKNDGGGRIDLCFNLPHIHTTVFLD